MTKIDGTIFADDSLFDQRRGSYESNYAPDSQVEGSLGALVWGHGVSDAEGPAHAAAARLKHFLSAAGVGVAKAPVKVGKVPTGLAQQLATLNSPPISTLIRDTNRPSDNFYAEMLLKDLGASYGSGGTTPAGAAVVRSANAALGISDAVVDGSGLSRANRTSAHQVVRLLTAMSQSSDFEALSHVAAGARRGHARAPHARDRRQAVPGQDRHADRRQRAVGLLPGPQRQPDRVLVHRERRLHQLREGRSRTGWCR